VQCAADEYLLDPNNGKMGCMKKPLCKYDNLIEITSDKCINSKTEVSYELNSGKCEGLEIPQKKSIDCPACPSNYLKTGSAIDYTCKQCSEG
jgi:hypothetical protein